MQNDEYNKPLIVDLNELFHPYEDKTLMEIRPDPPVLNRREPFNDVIKHGDIVAGFQQNRTLSDYTR